MSTCCSPDSAVSENSRRNIHPLRYGLALLAAAVVWWVMFTHLHSIADVVVFQLLRLPAHQAWVLALHFFIYEVPKVLLLLSLIVFIMSVLRTWVTATRVRAVLSGKLGFWAYVLAALFGVLTPFCSCSAVSLFVGFLTAGVPLGVTLSFLVSAPMVNEVALGLLWGLFGWKIAAIYLVTGLSIAIVAGIVLGKLNMEAHVEDWVRRERAEGTKERIYTSWMQRADTGLLEVKNIIQAIWLYLLLGIGVGAWIHGYIPENLMSNILNKEWWSVPLAVVMGVPMYSSAAATMPIVHALINKGAALGTTLAFLMAVVALSLPEMIILRKVLKWKLIIAFFSIVSLGILLVGYLFNALM